METKYPAGMRRRVGWGRQAAAAVCLASVAWAGAAHADYVVSGQNSTLTDITLDLVCEDLIVNGGAMLTVSGSMFQNIRYIIIGPDSTINATSTTFDVASFNVRNSGTFIGNTYTSVGSCANQAMANVTPVPANGPLGLALMGLLLGAAVPARRWLKKRRLAAR